MSKNEFITSLHFINYKWMQKTPRSHIYVRPYCWRLSPRPELEIQAVFQPYSSRKRRHCCSGPT